MQTQHTPTGACAPPEPSATEYYQEEDTELNGAMDLAGCSYARRERLRAGFQFHSLITFHLNNALLLQALILPLRDYS